MKHIDETRNYFIEEIHRNELVSKKHKKIGMTINYIEELLSLASGVTRCVSISAFNSLVGILRDVRRSAAGLKIIAITAGIKKHSKIKKHDKMVL